MFKNMTIMGKISTIFVLLILVIVCSEVAAEERTECTYKVIQVFEDGVMVSEKKIRECEEITIETDKRFNPQTNLNDYITVRLIDSAILGALIHLAK